MRQEAKPGSPDTEDGCSDAIKQSGMLSQRDRTERGAQLGVLWREAAAVPSSDVALGRIAAPRTGMLLWYTSDCGCYGERR